jgi:hypothetical protein
LTVGAAGLRPCRIRTRGFGYRRCPGEQLTIQVFEDFLRKVSKSGIEFQKLNMANPEPLPIGPTTVIGDNVGFTRTAQWPQRSEFG